MITFTKNVTKENRNAGTDLLGYFWRHSPLGKGIYAMSTNYNGFISWLDINRPTWIEWLGEQNNSFDRSQLTKAMEKAGKRASLDYRSAQNDIQKELMALVPERSNASYAAQAIGDTTVQIGKDIVDYSQTFTKLVFWGAGIFIVGYLIIQIGGPTIVKKIVGSVKG